MIYYQLPNGKAVYITVEQLLNLTHQDVQGLIADGSGHSNQNPFRKLSTPKEGTLEEDVTPDSPEMLSDGDDDQWIDVNIDEIPDS